ncbi:MAG: phosphate signaling complex protein PhoU [Gammaproteobacteria bacterium]|nr:phosphate signaling complex protein PhoU [Gammaproteobacteria bacterium]
MTDEHTLRLFDEEIAAMRAALARMGETVLRELDDAVVALLQGDTVAAQTAIRRDADVDTLHLRVREEVLELLARQAPVGRDLREAIALERVSACLERIGDHAKNCAKRTRMLDRRPSAQVLGLLSSLAGGVRAALARVLEAYAGHDATAAEQVRTGDAALDRIYNDLFAGLLVEMQADSHRIVSCVQLLFVARSLERIGDYATNIAEEVEFALIGSRGVAARPRLDTIERAD